MKSIAVLALCTLGAGLPYPLNTRSHGNIEIGNRRRQLLGLSGLSGLSGLNNVGGSLGGGSSNLATVNVASDGENSNVDANAIGDVEVNVNIDDGNNNNDNDNSAKGKAKNKDN